MNEKFITNLQGKEFILFEGLLNEFHESEAELASSEVVSSIRTEIISKDPFIVQATVTGQKGTFQGIGDADESNTNTMIFKHRYRMAETRAIARALRWYNNIGMCSADEMGGDDRPPLKEVVANKEREASEACSSCGSQKTLGKSGTFYCKPCWLKNRK